MIIKTRLTQKTYFFDISFLLEKWMGGSQPPSESEYKVMWEILSETMILKNVYY